VLGEPGACGERVRHRSVEVVDPDVEVNHLRQLAGSLGPPRRPVPTTLR
jgi:hypothetical protein